MNLRFEEEMKRERRQKWIKELLWYLLACAVVIFIAWLIVQFALKKVNVIGSAMETTLYNGEDVIVNKTSYLILSPRRESVVAFYPEMEEEGEQKLDDSSIMIRRIVGLPGEKIQITDGKIYIDGEELKESYRFGQMVSSGIANSEITLGEDEYFVLSDNRNDMDDSRNDAFTKVKKRNLIGKVILKFNPLSLIGGPDEQEE